VSWAIWADSGVKPDEIDEGVKRLADGYRSLNVAD
jgi:hypothetical protein